VISGLYGGSHIYRSLDGTVKIDNPTGGPVFHWDEIADFAVSNALNFWAECAVSYGLGGDWTEGHKFQAGVDILFFEPNATHTAAVRVWKGYDLLPSDTGLKQSYKDPSEDSTNDRPVSYAIRFEGDVKYNETADHDAADALLAEAPDYGVVPDWAMFYANVEPMHTLVLDIDPEDPDPETTCRTLLKTWGKLGVSVCIKGAQGTIARLAPPLNWDAVEDAPKKFEPLPYRAIQTLVWSDPVEPTEECRYNHFSAQCGLGEYRAEWKGWKRFDGCCLYLNGVYVGTYNDHAALKVAAQKHLEAIISGCMNEPQPPSTGNEVPEGWAVPKDTPV
jgi:hypothetical protein